MVDITSGNLAVDRFLANGYSQVPGMSSRFAAAICGHVIRRQSELGIVGDIAEIGTFEGRFFIAMALGLQAGERAIGIDVFDWPDAGVQERMLRNCTAAGLSEDEFTTWKGNTGNLKSDGVRAELGANPLRFMHIDGDHSPSVLSHDLELAHHAMHPYGIIAVDDMLHPSYPELIVTVFDYLARHTEMVVACIIDRETISAAAKFLICHIDAVESYEQDLMTSFERFHFIAAATVKDRLTLVLTPDPTLPNI